MQQNNSTIRIKTPSCATDRERKGMKLLLKQSLAMDQHLCSTCQKCVYRCSCYSCGYLCTLQHSNLCYFSILSGPFYLPSTPHFLQAPLKHLPPLQLLCNAGRKSRTCCFSFLIKGLPSSTLTVRREYKV